MKIGDLVKVVYGGDVAGVIVKKFCIYERPSRYVYDVFVDGAISRFDSRELYLLTDKYNNSRPLTIS